MAAFTSRYPTQKIWGVLRRDLGQGEHVVVALTQDPRVASKQLTEVLHWWRKGYSDRPDLKPALVSAEITWTEEEDR